MRRVSAAKTALHRGERRTRCHAAPTKTQRKIFEPSWVRSSPRRVRDTSGGEENRRIRIADEVTGCEGLANRRSTPQALRLPAQGCCAAATLGEGGEKKEQPQRGCGFFSRAELNWVNAGDVWAATPLGSVIDRPRTQGSACGATLGCGSKPLRGKCKSEPPRSA